MLSQVDVFHNQSVTKGKIKDVLKARVLGLYEVIKSLGFGMRDVEDHGSFALHLHLDFIESNEVATTQSVIAQILNAGFSTIGRIDHNMVEVRASGRDGHIELVINSAEGA